MPRYRRCTEEDVYRILLEAEARGESPAREDLAERVAVECDYKIGTARNLVKSSERMGFIKCSGRGRESLCKPVKEHYVDVAKTLKVVLDNWRILDMMDLRGKGISEEDFENALTHVVSRDRNSLAVARGVIRWWRKYEELGNRIHVSRLQLDSIVWENAGVYSKTLIDELRRLSFDVNERGFINGKYTTIDLLSWITNMIIDGVDCEESMRRAPGEVAPSIRLLCEKLGGRFTGKQLDILEDIAPNVVKALRINVMIKRDELLRERARERLREKADKLRYIAESLLRYYSKEKRIQGFCSYCANVPNEIKDIVKNLPTALRVAYLVGGVFVF
jgi:hypothetical protein